MKRLNEILSKIEKIDYSLTEETQIRLDNLTKPQGSLGKLEDLAKHVVEITRKKSPDLRNKIVFTLAGDHGVTEEGISLFPKGVTPQMVHNFLEGGAGINVLARHVGARVVVVDMGVDADFAPEPNLILKKVAYGTKNFIHEAAMTRDEAFQSIENGIEVFEEEFNKGIDIAATGEMGIGNTTSASAIASVITGASVKDVTGRGTGIDDDSLSNKINVIKKAIEVNNPNADDGIDILSKIGGFEIGGLVGIILAAASRRVPIVVDGFISSAAALIAYKIEPEVKDYMIASHCSVEKGHIIVWNYLGLEPVLDLSLRLGEGTGAALAMNIVDASVKILNEMATFEQANVPTQVKGAKQK
ncbi:MAG: nicotinate-nucleotide--dimethylbenzimidazole phosphoribosyltransferase [Candidatus Omnitrophica bacterium]|nr:nicotinate-nucleotide--dimethylbenzimidazole phosphoribosyltransferase [Candidatus Omnitrophota bacterium]